MATIEIPYSHSMLSVEIPDQNLTGVLRSKASEISTDDSGDQTELVRAALANPIGSPTLREMVAGKQKVVVISSDHTRPVPSHVTMPVLLDTIRSGNPDAEITILVATGYHRPTTHDELVQKYGDSIVANERIVVHNAFDDSSLVNLGTLPSGGELWLNRLAVEADLLIAEGFIEPHFFAGFSGGRKSVLPGVAGAQTVLANHCSTFIASDRARTGNLAENPIHRDMLFAAESAGLAHILNVVLNEDKEVISAFAGHSEEAHLAGCEYVRDLARVKALPADIVVVGNGGYPLDQNIYQAVKGMTAAEACCRSGGVIIMVAGCEDGHGGESFYREMATASSPQQVLEKVAGVAQDKTVPDQWEFQILARILSKHQVILVTDLCSPDMITDMHMLHASSFPDALEKALQLTCAQADITVIPDGVSVIVESD